MITGSNKVWTKSTRSGGEAACVEFAVDSDNVYVRDSKNKPVEIVLTAHDLNSLTSWVNKTQ